MAPWKIAPSFIAGILIVGRGKVSRGELSRHQESVRVKRLLPFTEWGDHFLARKSHIMAEGALFVCWAKQTDKIKRVLNSHGNGPFFNAESTTTSNLFLRARGWWHFKRISTEKGNYCSFSAEKSKLDRSG